MKEPRPVFISRLGHVSALGLNTNQAAQSLATGQRKVSKVELLGETYPWFALPLDGTDWTARARQALSLLADELNAEGGLSQVPLYSGSSSHATGFIEAMVRANELACAFNEATLFNSELKRAFRNEQEPHLFSTACTSGLVALEAACTLIAQGVLDEALVLGIEFASHTSLAGFASMGLLAGSEDQQGLILGEAAAGLWLTSRPGPWRIAACRLCIDGHAPTLPTPDGRVIAANLAALLEEAKLSASDIDLIKPGGLPGTDEAENAALNLIFARRPPEIRFKRQMGHTLGASGPAELTALLALLNQTDTSPQKRRVLFNLVGFGGGTAAVIVERCLPSGEPQ